MLNELAKEIHQNAVDHGFWDDPVGFPTVVALCHAELSEALEEDRAGKPMCYSVIRCGDESVLRVGIEHGLKEKPEGRAVEMIDCLIRILDWCGQECLDVDKIVRAKMDYNAGRERKHGKHY